MSISVAKSSAVNMGGAVPEGTNPNFNNVTIRGERSYFVNFSVFLLWQSL
jgi:hypothetical protein